MKISFTVPGDPVAKARARTFRNQWTGKVHGVTPEKTVNYENFVKWCASSCFPAPLAGPIVLTIHVYRKIPKSISRKQKAAAEQGVFRPTIKPDCSNYQKAIEDALNEIAYMDDSQVVSVHVHKFFSVNPRTEIQVEQIEEGSA